MRVLNTGVADLAGIAWLTKQALAPHIRVDLCFKKRYWLNYPTGRPWRDRERLARAADLYHVNASGHALARLPRKPVVLHHHGTAYRNNHQQLNDLAAALGARTIVSTVDLLDYAPADTVWYGAPYDLDWLATHRIPQHGDRIRIAHAPTNRAAKHTATFLRACEGLPVDVVLIEHTPWPDALKIKGTCDVLFDQLAYGYGSNAVEAWGMGIPVISGAAPHILERMTAMWGATPFYPATESTLRDAVEAMLDPATRQHWATVGRAHVSAHHSQAAARATLGRVYRELLQ